MNIKKIASANQLTAVPRQGTKQGNNTLVSNHYITGVNSSDTPETKALYLLREAGFSYVQQLDWVGKNDKDEWIVIEVKEKELFTPGPNFPHWGAGLNISQLYLRTKLLEELGLRTYLVVFAKGTNEVYEAYLDELEAKGGFYDSPNDIRIYRISDFTRKEYNNTQTPLPYSYEKRPRIKSEGGKHGR
jgi:hypothetical protein